MSTPTYAGTAAISVSLAAYGGLKRKKFLPLLMTHDDVMCQGFGIQSGFGVTSAQATGLELYLRATSGTLTSLSWSVNDDTVSKSRKREEEGRSGLYLSVLSFFLSLLSRRKLRLEL